MPSLVQTLSRQCTEYSVQDTVWTVQDPPPVGQLALALAGHRLCHCKPGCVQTRRTLLVHCLTPVQKLTSDP